MVSGSYRSVSDASGNSARASGTPCAAALIFFCDTAALDAEPAEEIVPEALCLGPLGGLPFPLARESERAALEQFHAHQEEGLYRRLEIGAAHYDQARRWVEAFSPPLRTLDALHLSIAAGAGATMLTADVQLARAARALHLACRLLRA